MLSVRPKQTLSMHTRDGVRLDADVYYPDASGPFPVLLMRQPYGRAIASTVVYAHPTWYATHGYIVVIQDVRGRGSSAGKFDLFAHEIEDGYDSVCWAAALPQSSGQVGMYGFSYQGMTQLYAAAARPPGLTTLCPSMVAFDLYEDWAYEGGAFCYQLNLGWAIQLAAETVRRQGNSEAYRTLYAAGRNPPYDPVCTRSGLLKQFAPDSHYQDWLEHATPDAYWDRLSPKSYLAEIDLPMLHIGGWFDPYMRGTLKLYQEMAARSRFRQALLVGPWAHLPWGRKLGAIDYGPEANNPVDRLQIRWFDHFLKGLDTGLLEEPPVCLFEMGSNQWRRFDRFPAANPAPYRLATTGLAAMGDREGLLLTPHSSLPTPPSPLPDTFVHDPWRPVPALGGHATLPAGVSDRAGLDCRTDVVTYTSPPLTADLYLAGEVAVELYCTADSSSFDLCAVLSDVHPNGSVYSFSQGYLRIQQTESPTLPAASEQGNTLHRLTLQPTCIRIPVGNAIRLSVSAACFPAYPVNTGTGKPSGDGRLIDAKVITVTIYSGDRQPSQVLLPLNILS